MKFIEFGGQLISVAYIVSVKKVKEGNPHRGFQHYVQIRVCNHPYGDIREYGDPESEDAERWVEERYLQIKAVLN